jgi:flagellar biosynthesis protein FlhA
MAAQGRQPFVIVSPLLRRAFSRFVSGRGSDAIVLAVNELPDNRRIEVVATLGGGQPAAPMGSSEPVRSE